MDMIFARRIGWTIISACCAVAIVAACSTGTRAADDVVLKPAEALAIPGGVLGVPPFDRLVLVDNTPFFIEPISPRPLPPLETKKDEKKSDLKNERIGGLVALGGKMPEDRARKKKEDPAEAQIAIHLVEGDARDFLVTRKNIKQVDYFEDFLLKECDRLVDLREYARAFECCQLVKARAPKWPGLSDRVEKVLYAEGTSALLDGQVDRGLRLLRELHDRRPDYPGLVDRLAKAYEGRLNGAFNLGLYPKGRAVLHELEQFAKDHQAVASARSRFIEKASGLVEEAGRAADATTRLAKLQEALRVWPKLEGASRRYEEAFRATPTLDVGVLDVAHSLGPWVRSPAEARVTRLLFLPILARDDEASERGETPVQLATKIETAELGRRLTINLRPGVPWADGSRTVAAVDVARVLTDRALQTSPLFNARWADLLDRVDATDETKVEVRLRRPALRAASWFVAPVGPAHAGWDGWVVTLEHGRRLVGDGPFRLGMLASDQARFDVATASGTTTPGKLAAIREHRYTSDKAAVAALAAGDVALIEHLPPGWIAEVLKRKELKVGRYLQPKLHLIALDGRAAPLRNRALRRALSFAVDRKTLLEETVARRPIDDVNVPSDGPFPRGSYADAPDVQPLEYQPMLAKMLVAAARKELGGAPIRLTFDYPAIPEARAVVAKLVERFRLVGLEIKTRERPESALEGDLRAGKRFELAYRVVECSEPAIQAGPTICPGYDAPSAVDPLGSIASPEILQLLLRLERAQEWPTARGLALQIDRECRDELPVIPLWQIEDHYAWRDRLNGPSETAETLYQGIDSWEIQPWFALDPW